MLKLFIKDNCGGGVREYGTDHHDSLVLQDDGSLHYYNLQCGVGTVFPEEGFSFCLEDGTIPEWDLQYGVEPFIDIGGEELTFLFNKIKKEYERAKGLAFVRDPVAYSLYQVWKEYDRK